MGWKVRKLLSSFGIETVFWVYKSRKAHTYFALNEVVMVYLQNVHEEPWACFPHVMRYVLSMPDVAQRVLSDPVSVIQTPGPGPVDSRLNSVFAEHDCLRRLLMYIDNFVQHLAVLEGLREAENMLDWAEMVAEGSRMLHNSAMKSQEADQSRQKPAAAASHAEHPEKKSFSVETSASDPFQLKFLSKTPRNTPFHLTLQPDTCPPIMTHGNQKRKTGSGSSSDQHQKQFPASRTVKHADRKQGAGNAFQFGLKMDDPRERVPDSKTNSGKPQPLQLPKQQQQQQQQQESGKKRQRGRGRTPRQSGSEQEEEEEEEEEEELDQNGSDVAEPDFEVYQLGSASDLSGADNQEEEEEEEEEEEHGESEDDEDSEDEEEFLMPRPTDIRSLWNEFKYSVGADEREEYQNTHYQFSQTLATEMQVAKHGQELLGVIKSMQSDFNSVLEVALHANTDFYERNRALLVEKESLLSEHGYKLRVPAPLAARLGVDKVDISETNRKHFAEILKTLAPEKPEDDDAKKSNPEPVEEKKEEEEVDAAAEDDAKLSDQELVNVSELTRVFELQELARDVNQFYVGAAANLSSFVADLATEFSRRV